MAKSKTPVTTPQAAQAVAILEKLSDTRKELRSLALNFLKPNLGHLVDRALARKIARGYGSEVSDARLVVAVREVLDAHAS